MTEEPKVITTEEELLDHIANLPTPQMTIAECFARRDTLWVQRIKVPNKPNAVFDVHEPESGSFGKLD